MTARQRADKQPAPHTLDPLELSPLDYSLREIQSCPAGQAGGVCVRINELPGSANLPGNREPESESRGATALELSELGGHGDNKLEHWKGDKRDFRREEEARRKLNGGVAAGGSTFMSHCWRSAGSQEKKFRIVAHLSRPAANPDLPPGAPGQEEGGLGLTYWADWLDLMAEGPVPWKQEIEKGIAGCSKFVALIDEAWLTSYNCLQELALAFEYSKPVVPLVLDQAAWDLLTVPGGAAKAKHAADMQQTVEEAGEGGATAASASAPQRLAMAVSASQAWGSEVHGPALMAYNGEHIVPGQPMSQALVTDLFARLAAINLCPCRDLEVANQGWGAVLSNATRYVAKDLPYHREHAELMGLEARWDAKGRPGRLLLPAADVPWWQQWVKRAEADRLEPRPTPAMSAFVAASRRATSRRRVGCGLLGGAVGALLLVAALVATNFAVEATRQAEIAREAEDTAMGLAEIAREAEVTAKGLAEIAMDAEGRAKLAQMETAILLGLAIVRDEPGVVPALWEAKVVGAVLSEPAVSSSAALQARTLNAARRYMQEVQDSGVAPLAVLPANSGDPATWVTALEWSPDSTHLAAGSDDGAVRVWRVGPDGSVGAAPPQLLLGWLGAARMSAVKWSPSGNYLAAAALETGGSGTAPGGIIRLWPVLPDGRVDAAGVQLLSGHLGWVWDLGFSPDGATLASCGYDATVRLWDVDAGATSDGAQQAAVLEGHQGVVRVIEWSPDGRWLASGGDDAAVMVWGVAGAMSRNNNSFGRDGIVAPMKHTKRVTMLKWAPDGSGRLASGGEDTVAHVYRLVNGSDLQHEAALEAHGKMLYSLEWSPDGILLATGSQDNTACVWPVPPAGAAWGPPQVLEGHTEWVMSVAWSSDGGLLATASWDGTVRVWERQVAGSGVPPMALTAVLDGYSRPFQVAKWAPPGAASTAEGMTLAVGTSGGHVYAWRVRPPGARPPRSEPLPLATMSGAVTSLAWSPFARGGRSQLAIGTDDWFTGVALWEGSLAADIAPAAPRVADAFTFGVNSVAFSRVGNGILASADSGGVIRIYGGLSEDEGGNDPPAGEEADLMLDPQHLLTTLEGHAGAVHSLAWAPGAPRLASGGADNTTRLWSRVSSEWTEQTALAGDGGAVTALAWSPGGGRLASGSMDGPLRVAGVSSSGWADAEGEPPLVLHACSRVSSLAWATYNEVDDFGRLACGTRGGQVLVWTLGEVAKEGDATQVPQLLRAHETDNLATPLAWSPDGRYLAAADEGGGVLVWHTVTAEPAGPDAEPGAVSLEPFPVQRLRGHAGPVAAVAWSPDGSRLASGGADNAVRVWSMWLEDMRAAYAAAFAPADMAITQDDADWHRIPGLMQQ